jgi:hypothetical protein
MRDTPVGICFFCAEKLFQKYLNYVDHFKKHLCALCEQTKEEGEKLHLAPAHRAGIDAIPLFRGSLRPLHSMFPTLSGFHFMTP